ncbi:MAG: hypothetical protein QOJ81_1724 [Chloroflexota bacterium]|jgi:hypothetical protein|nr:hypothetical protein [Chloroflexota bacterium]
MSTVFALSVGSCSASAPAPTGWTYGPGDAAHDQIKSYIEDVATSDGHVYAPRDDLGHDLSGAKIIQSADGSGFLAVYFHWDEATAEFRSNVGTSSDLLNWTWSAELGRKASQPTIAAASDGGYVVAWEQDPDNHLFFAYYPTEADLLDGRPTRTFEPPRQLSTCAEGTPSLYSASSASLDVAFHYYRDCLVDRQARGSTDWTNWSSHAVPELDAAMEWHGVEGGIGDRDGPFEFRGYQFMLFESMRTPEHWETFRLFLYDVASKTSSQLDMHTHAGSRAFTNPTIGFVTLDGRPAMVNYAFIPQEAGAPTEINGVVYYRFLD